MKPTLIIHIVIEIKIDACRRVIEQKPTRFRQRIAVGFRVDKHGPNTQRSLQQTFNRIVRQFGFAANVSTCKPLFALTKQT